MPGQPIRCTRWMWCLSSKCHSWPMSHGFVCLPVDVPPPDNYFFIREISLGKILEPQQQILIYLLSIYIK